MKYERKKLTKLMKNDLGIIIQDNPSLKRHKQDYKREANNLYIRMCMRKW